MIVYTAVFGSHDTLRPLPLGVHGVCFTDSPRVVDGWEMREAHTKFGNPRLTARWHKWMSHKLFPGEDTLWIDGNIEIKSLPAAVEFGAYLHREIRSAAEEFRHIGRCGRWPSEKDKEGGRCLMDMVRSAGYKDDEKHIETGLLIRKDTKLVQEFNELMWRLIDGYSIRDQLSCGFARHRCGLDVTILGPDMRRDVIVHKHEPKQEDIYYFVPYHKEGLGVAYNKCCEIVPRGSWICLMDADVMLFPARFGDIVQSAIRAMPEVDVWTTMVTRINNAERKVCPGGQRDEERDLVKLKEKALKHAIDNAGRVSLLETPALAGYFMLFRKEFWEKNPFPAHSSGRRVLGIDTHWSMDAKARGAKFGLIEGLLAVHYYSLEGQRGSHLKELEANAGSAIPAVSEAHVIQAYRRKMRCKPKFGRGLKSVDNQDDTV